MLGEKFSFIGRLARSLSIFYYWFRKKISFHKQSVIFQYHKSQYLISLLLLFTYILLSSLCLWWKSSVQHFVIWPRVGKLCDEPRWDNRRKGCQRNSMPMARKRSWSTAGISGYKIGLADDTTTPSVRDTANKVRGWKSWKQVQRRCRNPIRSWMKFATYQLLVVSQPEGPVNPVDC